MPIEIKYVDFLKLDKVWNNDNLKVIIMSLFMQRSPFNILKLTFAPHRLKGQLCVNNDSCTIG